MNVDHLDSELNKHLNEVISLRKVSLEDTKQKAINLWTIICNNQKFYSSKKVVVHHYSTGKVFTTFYSQKNVSNSSNKDFDFNIDEEFETSCDDDEFLEILCIIAENSDIQGKCRLCKNKANNKELILSFK